MQKFILITGCSTGIGLDCAKTIMREPEYTVIATVRQERDRKMLFAEGIKHVLILELKDDKSIAKALQKAQNIIKKEKGRLYSLINNAAYGQTGALEDITTKVLYEQFQVNFFAWHEITRWALQQMRLHNNGRIVQISSVLGLVTFPFRGPYNASKFALEGYCHTLRLELATTDIKISLVEPGPITSKFRDNAYKFFQENIDWENSNYKENYKKMIARFQSNNPDPFTLEANAVSHKVMHALKSNKPKVQYFVTFPTYLFAYLKRVLPLAWLDKVLLKV